eukprot:scaffold306719_cov33-Tisochrysis_lutea.AAC.2
MGAVDEAVGAHGSTAASNRKSAFSSAAIAAASSMSPTRSGLSRFTLETVVVALAASSAGGHSGGASTREAPAACRASSAAACCADNGRSVSSSKEDVRTDGLEHAARRISSSSENARGGTVGTLPPDSGPLVVAVFAACLACRCASNPYGSQSSVAKTVDSETVVPCESAK